jgi:hypothetical protein
LSRRQWPITLLPGKARRSHPLRWQHLPGRPKRAPTRNSSHGWSRSACGRGALAPLRTLRLWGESLPVLQVVPDDSADTFLTFRNNSANHAYTKECIEAGIKIYPARFTAALPKFFVRPVTEIGDLVVDPFAGSNTTGMLCEHLQRRWLAMGSVEEYLSAVDSALPRLPKADDQVQGPVSILAEWGEVPQRAVAESGGNSWRVCWRGKTTRCSACRRMPIVSPIPWR